VPIDAKGRAHLGVKVRREAGVADVSCLLDVERRGVAAVVAGTANWAAHLPAERHQPLFQRGQQQPEDRPLVRAKPLAEGARIEVDELAIWRAGERPIQGGGMGRANLSALRAGGERAWVGLTEGVTNHGDTSCDGSAMRRSEGGCDVPWRAPIRYGW
jgi:hypothetical protein